MTTDSEPEEGVYGPGSYTDVRFVPVPEDSARIMRELASRTPGFTQDPELLASVEFTGHDLPAVPGPIKSVAVTAALFGMMGILGQEILELRGVQTDKKTKINTDAAALYLGTPATIWIDGVDGPAVMKNPKLFATMNTDIFASPLAYKASAIYPTKKSNEWYQLHGSTNHSVMLAALGINPDQPSLTSEEAYEMIANRTRELTASEIELLMIEGGFAGSIVFSPEQWRQTSMGTALARHPLINYHQVPLSKQLSPPVAFPPFPEGDRRPLAGVKVLELARIIAAPAAGMLLAAMGAQVIRVQTDRLPDFDPGQLCFMAGHTTYNLDINKPEDAQRVRDLISEADVVIQGYRPRVLERRGMSLDFAVEAAAARKCGIVWLNENCYGPDGAYAERVGWQQVADAAAGSEWVMASSFDLPAGQGVLPPLPISDMSTGAVCAVTILCMLRDRARYGGSWVGASALTAYNATTLEPWVGLYPRDTVARISRELGFNSWGSDVFVIPLYYEIFETWKRIPYLMDEDKFVHFDNSVYGKDLKILAPVVRYSQPDATPRWVSPPVPFLWHPYKRWDKQEAQKLTA